MSESATDGTSSTPAESCGRSAAHPVIQEQPWCGRYALPSADFSVQTVGAKARNTVKIQVRFGTSRSEALSLRV